MTLGGAKFGLCADYKVPINQYPCHAVTRTERTRQRTLCAILVYARGYRSQLFLMQWFFVAVLGKTVEVLAT
jgi:hypothetical protein